MKSYMKYLISLLFLIGVIVVIVLLFNLIRNIFTSDSPEQQQTGKTRSYDLIGAGKSGQPVRYTVQGAVVGNEEHRSISITVDARTRKLEVLQSYNNQVIKSQETPNTQEAYNAFIAAINGAGFTSNVRPEGRGDEAQSCPLGRKYIFEAAPGTSNSFRTWSTSCGKKQGTFTGNQSTIQTLFQDQIPNYSQLVSGVQLN